MLTKDLNIIGIYGHAGVGKDTVAGYIHGMYERVWGEAFALPLKKAVSKAFGIPEEWFHDRDIKELIHPIWGTSPRIIAQFVGTEMFRNLVSQIVPDIGKDFWIRRLEGKLNGVLLLDDEGEYDDGDTIIITDVRFQNEINWLEDVGGKLIHLTRNGFDGAVGIPGHGSENPVALSSDTFRIINDGTLEELYASIDAFINWTQFDLERKLSEAEVDKIVSNL